MTRSKKITIPEWEIGPGWYISDLETADDCRDAIDYCDEIILGIAAQLKAYDENPECAARPEGWRFRAEKALIYRKKAKKRAHLKLRELNGHSDVYEEYGRACAQLSAIKVILRTSPDETLRADLKQAFVVSETAG